jgi:hypothetical protein
MLRAPPLAILLALILGFSLPAAAQGTNATITGTITDAQGGVLPGVTVTIRNVDTGVARNTVTEADGRYRVGALPSGRYAIKAELQGFQTAEVPGVTLTIGQELRQDLSMMLGTVQETVTVTGQAPVVEPTASQVSAIITQEQIATLPVANRATVTLSLLLPGTSQDGSRPRRNNAQVGAGTLQFTTNHLVDGTMNMSTKAGEPRQDFPQSAILEFKVLTSQAPSEYGGRAGGVVSVVTRSGTNRFTGEAYEFFRNKDLGRPDKFKQEELDRTGADKPRYERHQFGGALGGPIIKDRLHFFVAAEDTSERQAYIITTGKPEFYGKFEGIFPNSNTDRLFFARGDMQLTTSQNVFARWGYQGNTLVCEGCGGNDATGDDTYIPRDSFVAGHTWVLSPRLLNEARFQWAQQWQYSSPSGAGFWKELSFGPARFARVQPLFNFPSFSYGADNFFVHHSMIREFRDDFSIALSDHHVKFGGAFQNLPLEEDLQGNPLGTWNFTLDQPFDLANLNSLRGPINSFTASFPPLLREQAHHYYQMYTQDEWRARENLTLNLGLRYELDTLVWNENRDMSFYPRPLPLVNFASRGDDNNVSPRIGVAWDVMNDGRTVVRAGVGRQYNVIMNGTPGGETMTLRQTSINIRNPSYPDPYQGRSPASFASTAPPNIQIVDDNMVNPYSDTVSVGFSRELRQNLAIHADGVYTKSDKFNATVQINSPPDPARPTVVPMPEWGRIQQVQSIGWQKYQALLVRVEKRFADRHQYTISYTLAKTTDNSFGGTSTGTITDAYHRELDEGYGNSDRRHALVASGAMLLPGDVTLGGVWTIRGSAPFSARAGRDLNADGANTDYVPGTHKGQGNRDLDLGLVNAWRAQNGLRPIPDSQIDTTDYSRFDVRLSKSFPVGGTRKVEIIGQVFNLFGRDNLGGIGASWQTNALSDAFGRQLGAQPRQQAEFAVRTSW